MCDVEYSRGGGGGGGGSDSRGGVLLSIGEITN